MKRSQSQSQRIRDYFNANPDKSVSDVAKAMGLKYQIVYVAKRNMDRKKASKRGWSTVHISASSTPLPVTMHEPKSDPVNHPAHYKVGGIETIDFIEAKRLNYNLGNAVKYITRADHKGNRKQDIEKAVWYLQRELSHML